MKKKEKVLVSKKEETSAEEEGGNGVDYEYGQRATAAHNKYRAKHGAAPLEYSLEMS